MAVSSELTPEVSRPLVSDVVVVVAAWWLGLFLGLGRAAREQRQGREEQA